MPEQGWISHWAMQDNAIFPGDMYALCIKFDKLSLKADQHINVGENHNWYTPLISGQQIEVGETIKVDGTWIITQV